MLRRVCALALAVAVLGAASGGFSAPTVATEETDAALQFSELPNGFRYSILPHARGTGRISLRLIVHAGSLDEGEDELGYAHFVEHMAFNGTRHYPPGRLVRFFQRLGIAFGADVNAATSFTGTAYRIDLPVGHAAQLPEALKVLRDFADGIEFDPTEVNREKGVLASELRARDTSAWREKIERIGALYEGTSLPARLPIADSAAVSAATAESLRRFYERCYRPNRMTLLVVGDCVAATTAALVEKSFTTMRGGGARVALPAAPALRGGALRARAIVNPMKTAVVSLISSAPRPPDTRAGREADLAARVVYRVLSRRLTERRVREADIIGAVYTRHYAGADERYQHFHLEAQMNPTQWRAGLALIASELRLARKQGFDEAEWNEAIATVLARQRALADQIAGELPETVIKRVAATLAAGRTWHAPASDQAFATEFLPTLSREAARPILDTMFPDEGMCLIVVAPQPIEGGSESLLAAYREVAGPSDGDAMREAAAALEFRYSDFGPPGMVANRRTDRDLGIELVQLSNGTRLNLLATKREPHRFHLAARIGRGGVDQPKNKPGIFFLSTALLSRSDLGRHTSEEFSRLLGLHALEMSIKGGDHLTLSASGPNAELPFALQFLAAFLSDVKLDPAKHDEAVMLYSAARQHHLGTTAGRALVEMMYQMTGRHPRADFPTGERVKAYPFEEVCDWIRTYVLHGPLEIGIVGDFDAAATIDAAAASVGTLGTRVERPIGPDERLTLISKYYRNILSSPVPDPAAAVRVAWPAASAADAKVHAALNVGLDALLDRLRIKLREDLGVTYASEGGVHRDSLQRDFGMAWVSLSFEPGKAKNLAERTLRIAGELARRGVTREEFKRLIEPRRAAAAANLQANGWWLKNVLTWAQSVPETLEDARRLESVYRRLTRRDVNRAVKLFDASKGSAIVILPAGEPVPMPPKANAPKP